MADAQGKLPPSKLGEYTVIRDIAEGTFGKVKSMSLSLLFLSPILYINFQWQSIRLPVTELL